MYLRLLLTNYFKNLFAIFKKEISSFFSSYIAYIVISVFLILMGLVLWVFTDTSILENKYAQLDPLFTLAPLVFIFMIPATTMRSFSEELQFGTMELLQTKPITNWDIVLGKYLANVCLVLLALFPTLIYFYSVYQLGSPVGNLDKGSIVGSYIGLSFLVCTFVSIGLFASTLSKNQIIAFLIGALLCFLIHYSFDFISSLPIFFGSVDDIVEELGCNYHYGSISKGMIDTRDVVYFISVVAIFLLLSKESLSLQSK